MSEILYEDEEFGNVMIKINNRARRVIFRVKDGILKMTCPPCFNRKDIIRSIEGNREGLRRLFERVNKKSPLPFYEGQRILCGRYTLNIGRQKHFPGELLLGRNGYDLSVLCYESVDMGNPDIQDRIRRGIEILVRKAAEDFLPIRVRENAARLGLRVGRVTIGRGRRKLGHCTGKGDISLSFYLMFLPFHLVDYIIFHELAHLSYMDHSEAFHRLCDVYCGGKEKKWRSELRKFVFPID